MQKIIIRITLLLVISYSCSNPLASKVKDLKNDAIAIHDEVMPRMGEISELSVSLKQLREKLKSDTTDSAVAAIEQLSDQIVALDNAYEGMMEWMSRYEPQFEEQHPLDSAVIYYEEQRSLITDVKLNMEQSINDAKTLLGE